MPSILLDSRPSPKTDYTFIPHLFWADFRGSFFILPRGFKQVKKYGFVKKVWKYRRPLNCVGAHTSWSRHSLDDSNMKPHKTLACSLDRIIVKKRMRHLIADGMPVDTACRYTMGQQSFVIIHGQKRGCAGNVDALVQTPETSLQNRLRVREKPERAGDR